MRCPICHRSRSKNTHRPFTATSLAQHVRDMRPPKPDELQELSNEYDDLSDGAFFALAHELGLI